MQRRPGALTAEPRRAPRTVRGIPLTTVWAVAAVAIPTAVAISTPLSSVDLAYQIRAGETMLDAGRVLREDVLTISTLGRPWLNQQWGAQVVLAAVFGTGGWFALSVLRAVVTALVCALLYASCRNAGASRRWSAGLTIAAGIVATGGFLVRPQLFGVACFAATQWLLSRRDRHPHGVWWALPVTVVWANTHGSFPLSLVLFGIAWAQDRSRGKAPARLVVVGVATALAALANPFGARIWSYVVSVATDPRIRNGPIEWRPPTVETVTGTLFLLSVVAVALFVGSRWSAASGPTLAALGLFLVLGLLSVRGSLWWDLAAPYLVASVAPGAPPEREREDPRGWLNVALAATLGLIAIAPLVRWLPYRGEVTPASLVQGVPTGITHELDDLLDPGEPFFNPQRWGSWFEFALPDNPVLVDSRWEVIPERTWDDYHAVSEGRHGWQGILDRYGFEVVVLAYEQQRGLLPAIERDPGWALAYRDADGAVFTRSGAG